MRQTAQLEVMELTNAEAHEVARTVRQEAGQVVARVRSGYAISLGNRRIRAKKAASCLLLPRRNDRVLVAIEDGGEAYVLAVLEQGDPASSELELHGDTTLNAVSGRLRVASKEGVDIVSPKDVSVTAHGFKLRAAAASLLVDTLEHFGSRVLADVQQLRAKAATIDTVAERVSQRAKRVYRTVEDLEQVRVGQLDISAKHNLRLHAKNALLTALSLVKVDGEQIHMG